MFRRLNKKLELSGYNTFCIFFSHQYLIIFTRICYTDRAKFTNIYYQTDTFIKIINVYLHWLPFWNEFIITINCNQIGKYSFLPILLFISNEIWPQTQLQLHVYIIIGMWHRDKHWVMYQALTLYNYSGKVNNDVNYENS